MSLINNNEYYQRVTRQNFKELSLVPFEVKFVKDIEVHTKDITLFVVILEMQPTTRTKEEREIRIIKVADATAQVTVVVWDGLANPCVCGDIVKITKLYASPFKNCLTLYTSKVGEFEKLGEFTFVFNDKLDKSTAAPTVIPPNNPLYSGANFRGAPAISGGTTQSAASYAGPASNRRDAYRNPPSNFNLPPSRNGQGPNQNSNDDGANNGRNRRY